MATAKPRPKRQRRNFSHLEQTPAARILDVPNLIDIQRASFRQFMESGIREVIKDISPIEDYTGTRAVEFGESAKRQLRLFAPSPEREALTGLADGGRRRDRETREPASERPAQRIGLSATVRPVEEVARFLAGGSPVSVVQPPSTKEWDLDVVVPVPDLGELGGAGG